MSLRGFTGRQGPLGNGSGADDRVSRGRCRTRPGVHRAFDSVPCVAVDYPDVQLTYQLTDVPLTYDTVSQATTEPTPGIADGCLVIRGR